jgi:hypothetical protein
MLRARECTPTPPFVVFTFGLEVESIKELEGVLKTRNEQEHNKSNYAFETYKYHPTFITMIEN